MTRGFDTGINPGLEHGYRASSWIRQGGYAVDMAAEINRFLSFQRVERGASPHTLRAYGKDLGGLESSLLARGQGLLSAKSSDLRMYLAERSFKAPSAASQRRAMSAIRSFYRWAIEMGLCRSSPAEHLSLPKLPERLPRHLSSEQASAMVENPIQDGWHRLRNQAILELLYGSGLRVAARAVGSTALESMLCSM